MAFTPPGSDYFRDILYMLSVMVLQSCENIAFLD